MPRWAETPDEVKEFIHEAHAQSTNLSDIDGDGEGVHIGIIDSTCRVSPHIAAGVDVNQGPELSFLPRDPDDATGHGTEVFKRARAFAPGAEYSLYQAANAGDKLPLAPYSDAITRALDDDVDIVNVSAGHPWPHPVEYSPTVPETRRLLDAGIAVVAAAGNYFIDRQHERPPVHCPSAAAGVVSVAGLRTLCPAEPGSEPPNVRRGPYYWQNPHRSRELAAGKGVYCGERGCVDGQPCDGRKKDTHWIYNPSPTGGKPDVLAPMHIIRQSSRSRRAGEYLEVGTSFAAPLVTAALACIFSDLQEADGIPDPYTVESAIRETATPVDGAAAGKLDAVALKDRL